MKTTGPKDFAVFLRAFAAQLSIELGSRHSKSAALLTAYADELDPQAPAAVHVETEAANETHVPVTPHVEHKKHK